MTTVLLSLVASGSLAAEGLTFARLGLHTTLDDARRRYPRSEFSGHYVHLTDEDSHDGIRGIGLPSGPRPQLRILFERSGTRANIYPPCDAVLGPVKKQYGEATNLQEFDEERARNRRFIWEHRGERLSVLCFRVGRGAFSAAELIIERVE